LGHAPKEHTHWWNIPDADLFTDPIQYSEGDALCLDRREDLSRFFHLAVRDQVRDTDSE